MEDDGVLLRYGAYRRHGETHPLAQYQRALRVGVAGPTSRASLLNYAMKFGTGRAIHALRGCGKNMLRRETPTDLLRDLATAQAGNPGLGIDGVHCYTFGSAARSAEFAATIMSRNSQ